MGTKFSDLPFSVQSEKVVVIRPYRTKNATKFQEKDFQPVFDDLTKLTGIVHSGSLHCYDYCGDPGKPMAWIPCGGTLWLRETDTPLGAMGQLMKERASFVFTCSDCPMYLGIQHLSRQEIANLMLHLMLKQMIPNLQTLNFIECSQTEWQHDKMEEIQRIRNLGVISVASRLLWGNWGDRHYFSQDFEEYGLGFMPMPGMNTREGCDGFDAWLKFLVQKKFESLTEQHRQMAPMLIGPKPRTKDR